MRLRPSLAVWAVAALLGVASPGAAARDAPAIPSELAIESLLLGVARVGDRLVAVGEWGHVLLSDDEGESWRQARGVPTRTTLTAVDFADDRNGWAVGHGAVVLHTGDAGETWKVQHVGEGEDDLLLGVWFENARHGIAVGAFGLVLVTRDGGETWEQRALTDDREEDFHLNSVFAGSGQGSVLIAAESGWVYRSQDGGDTWEKRFPGYAGSFWGGLTIDESNLLVFGMRGHMYRSGDGGETWQEVHTGTDQSLQGATRLRDGSIVVVGLGGVVLASTNTARDFSVAIQPNRRGIAAVAEGPDGGLLLFGETGLQRRERLGKVLLPTEGQTRPPGKTAPR